MRRDERRRQVGDEHVLGVPLVGIARQLGLGAVGIAQPQRKARAGRHAEAEDGDALAGHEALGWHDEREQWRRLVDRELDDRRVDGRRRGGGRRGVVLGRRRRQQLERRGDVDERRVHLSRAQRRVVVRTELRRHDQVREALDDARGDRCVGCGRNFRQLAPVGNWERAMEREEELGARALAEGRDDEHLRVVGRSVSET